MRTNVFRQAPKTSFFAGYAGILPAFFNKMRARRPRTQGFSELVFIRSIGFLAVLAVVFFAAADGALARDFLTEQEIALMRKNQDIDKRTGIFMNAAALRLNTVLDRFEGIESKPGDALEFFSQEEMLDDYYKIIEHVMLVVRDAFESPRRRENVNIKKALQTLKSESPQYLEKLAALKIFAGEKQKKNLLNRLSQAIDITEGLLEGAEDGLLSIAEQEREAAQRK